MGTLKNLDPLLEGFIKEDGPSPAGAGLRVYQGEDCLYERYIGYRDAENRLPFTSDTICQLASMTKCIAVTAAMQLYEKGLFLLTDPVENYIPEFADRQVYDRTERGELFVRPAKSPVTVGQLFDMTCGVTVNWDRPDPNSHELFLGTEKLLAEGKYNLQEYAKLAGRVPGAFDPGTHFYYGQGHDILAALVEILSGKRFGEYLQENIFEPLGIRDAGFKVPEEKQDRLAVMYALTPEGRKLTKLPDIFYAPDFESACGGLYATLEDYSRFARCMTLGEWNGVRLLNDRTIRLMAMNRLPEDIRKADFENAYHAGYGYGLGLRTRMYPAAGSNTSFGEFGWTGGFGTWVLMDPAEKITIVYCHQSMPNREEFIHPRIRNIVYSAL
ncbi:MAG: beta-lactamase family protein [Lachnospiraceae bacterium]|nr:beta-lactamase family protein [Lachnospiraceae bacterium]